MPPAGRSSARAASEHCRKQCPRDKPWPRVPPSLPMPARALLVFLQRQRARLRIARLLKDLVQHAAPHLGRKKAAQPTWIRTSASIRRNSGEVRDPRLLPRFSQRAARAAARSSIHCATSTGEYFGVRRSRPADRSHIPRSSKKSAGQAGSPSQSISAPAYRCRARARCRSPSACWS